MIEESKRQKSIKAKVLKNGNIRFFQDDERKSAVSEMQLQSGDGVAQTITTLGNAKIIEYAKTTRGADVVSTIRASYYKTWERNIRENVVSGKGYEGVIEKTKYIVAMRGRGENNEQQLEPNTQGVVNALTTVQKDNLVMEKKRAKQNDEEKRIREILYILREKIGEKTFCEWSIRGLFCILQTEILRQNVYAEELFENWKTATELEQFTHNGTIDKQFVATTDSVRDLWGAWKTGCSSYRRQFSEQQFIEFKSFVQKLPHEDTQTKIFMFCLWEAGEGIWILRKALSEIQEIWKPTSDKQGAWSYRIRKLTPREVWRLMGYTDEDFDRAAKVNSNTQLYKEAGNAIVKQVLMAIFRQLNIQGLKPWNDRGEENERT